MSRREDLAAHWALMSPPERQASPDFARWIARPGNRRLFDQMSGLLDGLSPDSELADLPLPPARRVSRRQMIGGGAALVAAGAAGVVLWPQGDLVHTGRGERLSLTIPGGEVLVDAGSRLRMPGDGPLSLLSGRAEIRSTGPVRVALPGCELTARGRVSLHRAGPGSETSVIDGTCRARLFGGPDLAIAKGRQARIVPGQDPVTTDTDLTEVLAWTQGRAVFDDRPLWLVIEDMNRYRAGQVRLLGDLGKRRVSGSYPTDRPDQGLDGLVAGLSLTRHDLTHWLVLLSA